MRKLILCIAVVIFCASPCMGDEGRYKFQFVSDYIRSLKHLKMIEEETSVFYKQHLNYIQYTNVILTYLRSADSKLITAREIMSKYGESEDQIIKSAAESILLVYDNLVNIQHETIKMFEELERPEIINNPEEFDMENFMNRTRELRLKHDEFLKAFDDISLMVTYVLVSWEPDTNGRLNYLAVSRSQREALIRELDDAFGNEKGSGMKAGKTYLYSGGAILRKVLEGEHKSSDER